MEGIRKGFQVVTGLVVLLAVFLCPSPGHAEVNVNVHIGPPAVVVAAPPELIVVPRTMVYFAPDVEADLLFYGGFWWTPKEGRWFRAKAYKGPWVIVGPRHVPVEIVRLPRGYRRVYSSHRRIPYGQLKKHRELRERERRERRGEWKEGKEERKERRKEHRGNGHR